MEATATTRTVDAVFEQAERLSDSDKLKLIKLLADSMLPPEIVAAEKRRVEKAAIRQAFEQRQSELIAQKSASQERRSSYGVLAHLGHAASEEDIAEARETMMANFPREDIV